MTTKSEYDATLTMTLTPDMEEQMKGFPFFLEIEMLRADKKRLEDGRIEYSNVIIEDAEKSNLVKEFVLKMISHSHLQNGN
jgi:hypothetical protein